MAVRIAQISDLHLTAREHKRSRRSPVWLSFRRALAFVTAATEPIDRLILTGDLAQDRQRDTYTRLREAVDSWGERVLAIPGNHDDRPMFLAAFGDRVVRDRPTANFVDDVDVGRLIGLDTLRPRRVHGRLGADQLAWLRRTLAADEAPALVFLHHPPLRVGCWWLDKDYLRDASGLESAVAGSSVQAFFAGHVHQECRGTFGSLPVYTCPSSAYQFPPNARLPRTTERGQPALRLIEWDGGPPSSRVIRLAAVT